MIETETMRNPMMFAALLCTFGTACFDIEEQITVEVVAIDEHSAELSAQMIFRDAEVEDGTVVTFRTDSGSFEEDRERSSIDVPSSGGKATAILYRACDLSNAEISVSFTTINRSTPSAQQLVEFPAVRPTTNRDLGFTCAAANIAALDEGLTGETFEVDCNLTAPNRAALLPAFGAEAGSFVLKEPTERTRCPIDEVVYRVIVGEDMPQNVAPLPHRCIDELSYPSAGDGRPGPDTFRNPRDGLVTLVVYASGAEGFDDNNGNGVWDLGEPFDDLPEPFVDADDNGQWTPGEWYQDVNGNGAWDEGNGRYDEATVIWKKSHILWTGQPWTADHEKASRLMANPSIDSMTPGDGRSVRIRVVDRNLNPVAAHGTNDQVRVEASRDLELVHGSEAALSQTMGLVVGADGTIDHVVEQGECNEPLGRSFSARVRDNRGDLETCEAALVSITAEVRYTPAPGIRQRTVQLLPLEGRLRACNP